MTKRLDLTGKHFGSLEALRRVESVNGVSRWRMYCHACQRETTVNQRDLPRYKTCGCGKRVGLSGVTFGRLTLLETKVVDGKEMCVTQCNCPQRTIQVVPKSVLMRKSRPRQSCGCLSRERAKELIERQQAKRRRKIETEMLGQRFGHGVIRRLSGYDRKAAKWELECDCGNTYYGRTGALRFGSQRSCGCRNGLTDEANMLKVKVDEIRRSAKARDLDCSLDDLEIESLIACHCSYCGAEPDTLVTRKAMRGSYRSNGIDRVDNACGYRPENVVPACKICNRAKRDLKREQFLAWIERLRLRYIDEWSTGELAATGR